MQIKFKSRRISEHLIRILDGSDVCEYLIVGSEKAILIDTGYGIGDLKSFVGTLTDRPVEVYLTHGHVDHASGAAAFDRVHMSHRDLALADKHCRTEFRRAMLEMHGNRIDDEAFIPQRTEPVIDIHDGETVDLGGVHVLFVSVPGHTEGTVVPIVIEDRAAIYGDACGVGTLLCLDGSASVSEYLNSLRHLQEYDLLYDIVLRQHGTFESAKDILAENIENCIRILNGTDDHVPDTVMGNLCFWACRKDPATGKRTDGKEGNICYMRAE